jgi:hypothetical protein
LQHVAVAAKIIVTPDGAYVVVGVDAAKMAANVKSRGIATIYSDSMDTTSGTSFLKIKRDEQHTASQIISRRRKKSIFVVLSTITALQVPHQT